MPICGLASLPFDMPYNFQAKLVINGIGISVRREESWFCAQIVLTLF